MGDFPPVQCENASRFGRFFFVLKINLNLLSAVAAGMESPFLVF